MNCTVDIKKDGRLTVILLPFDPRTEFGIPQGTVFVRCVAGGVTFKSKLISKGGGKYFIILNKKLLSDIGAVNGEKLQLNIEADITQNRNSPIPETAANEFLTLIKQRSSIRKFKKATIDKLYINAILNAGLCAPTAMNKRPFHFAVIETREKMISIAEANSKLSMLYFAAACIIICGDRAVEGTPEFLIADCAAASQNILLAVSSLGLGGVWCGIRQNSDLYKNLVRHLELPNHIRPVSLVAFGYPDEEKIQQERYESEKIHFENW